MKSKNLFFQIVIIGCILFLLGPIIFYDDYRELDENISQLNPAVTSTDLPYYLWGGEGGDEAVAQDQDGEDRIPGGGGAAVEGDGFHGVAEAETREGGGIVTVGVGLEDACEDEAEGDEPEGEGEGVAG